MALTQIVSDDDLMDILGHQSGASLDRMRAIRTQVESLARRFVGHQITQPSSDHVEFHPLQRNTIQIRALDYYDVVNNRVVATSAESRRNKIQLRQKWARSITSVWEDLDAEFGSGASDFASATLLTSGTDYTLQYDGSVTGIANNSMLIRINRWWPSKPGTVKIQYNAGLTAAELADEYLWIKHAIIEDIALRFYYHNSQAETTFGQTTGAPQKEQSIPGDFKETYDTTVITATLLSDLSPGTKRKLHSIKHRVVNIA